MLIIIILFDSLLTVKSKRAIEHATDRQTHISKACSLATMCDDAKPVLSVQRKANIIRMLRADKAYHSSSGKQALTRRTCFDYLCDCYRVDSAGAENLDGADQRMCGGRYCFSVYSKDFTPAVCRILSSISSALG